MQSLPFQSSASINTLRARAAILAKIRSFFDTRNFFEVQTPTLSRETVVDQHIDPISLPAAELQTPHLRDSETLYLQTSPEFAMKRLLVSGADAIYQICPAYRSGESGIQHNPEFTILEWYRAGDSFRDGINLLSDFAKHMLNEKVCEVVTYQQAFKIHAGFDPLDVPSIDITKEAERLGIQFDVNGLPVDEFLNITLDQIVGPRLGTDSPTILTNYPSSQAALAQVCKEDPRTAERFELFTNGVELANGYGELTNHEILLDRSDTANRMRVADGKPILPRPKLLHEAMMTGLPASSGCALGVDRLVAQILNLSSIADTLAFPIDRA